MKPPPNRLRNRTPRPGDPVLETAAARFRDLDSVIDRLARVSIQGGPWDWRHATCDGVPPTPIIDAWKQGALVDQEPNLAAWTLLQMERERRGRR